MKIVLVIDQFDDSNNGTTVTARRFAGQLRRRGHEVVILAGGAPCEGKICAPVHRIPVFQKLIESQGMCFAKPDEEAYYTAFKDADIVHFYMPFRFCRRGGGTGPPDGHSHSGGLSRAAGEYHLQHFFGQKQARE